MPAILHHRSLESSIHFNIYFNDKTKDVNHEYTGSYSRTHNSGFPYNQRRRIANQIIYSGENT